MRHLLASVVLGFKRFFNRWTGILLIPALLGGWYAVSIDSMEYHGIVEYSKEFVVIEKSNFKQLQNLADYSKTGFRLMCLPSPASVLFSSPSITSDLAGRINSVVVLEIYNDAKKKLNMDNRFPYRIHVSDIVLYYLSLLSLIQGYLATRSEAYSRFISAATSPVRAYFYNIVPALLMVILGFILFFACMLIFAILHGVHFTASDITPLAGFVLASIFLLSKMFLAGTIIGFIKSRFKAFLAVLALWSVFIILIPSVIHHLAFNDGSQKPSRSVLINNKWKIVKGYEVQMEQEHGDFNPNDMEQERKNIETYLREFYPQMEALEKNHKAIFEKESQTYTDLSTYFPVSFFNLVTDEASSRGYSSHTLFYDHLIKEKKAFVRFWIDLAFYKKKKKDFDSYIKHDENIFRLQSRLPYNFSSGISTGVVWLLFLFILSLSIYARSFARLDEDEIRRIYPGEINHPDSRGYKFDFNTESSTTWYVNGSAFIRMLSLLFLGKPEAVKTKGFKGPVNYQTRDLCSKPERLKVLTAINPNEIPGDIRVGDLVRYVGRLLNAPSSAIKEILETPEIAKLSPRTFGSLKRSGDFEGQVIGALAPCYVPGADVYLLDQVDQGFPLKCARHVFKHMERMCPGSVVINLVNHTRLNEAEFEDDKLLMEGSHWYYWAKSKWPKNRY